ncbi:unnamed protein product [Gongylonema pulchrum]|uniref:Secreted protein n=1 Tax=Gongylonema pulchrum TaxID=637853 RepID=A0A183DCF0_9BILA|nr:unnamed protein product [Gongylonema pulchrum]
MFTSFCALFPRGTVLFMHFRLQQRKMPINNVRITTALILSSLFFIISTDLTTEDGEGDDKQTTTTDDEATRR